MQGIGFVGEVKEHDVKAIVDAACTRMSAIPAFDLRIGPEALDPEAVLLHVHPDEPVRAVRDAVRAAIGDVLGEAPQEAEGRLHPTHLGRIQRRGRSRGTDRTDPRWHRRHADAGACLPRGTDRDSPGQPNIRVGDVC
ncbi:hypothetical protein ABT065_44800 [Streptomyces sp. NPDC002764]|uniref:hypothetical protein n=1 Tax=Streptomyces sp. NPDC002764 TaxID=3154428 RepID=UPI00331EEF88